MREVSRKLRVMVCFANTGILFNFTTPKVGSESQLKVVETLGMASRWHTKAHTRVGL